MVFKNFKEDDNGLGIEIMSSGKLGK